MSRLPTPGGDRGNWGQILNDYLSQAHKPDGTLKDNAVSSASLTNNSISEDKLDTLVRSKLNSAGGTQGATGPQGPAGTPGAGGATGPQGTAGAPGSQGATGPKGDQGNPGIPGAAGATGATGPQGLAGTNGTNGQAGATGPKGDAGTPGANGTQGATGPQGASGPAGTTSWAGITDKPAVIAAGATAAAARAAIGAGVVTPIQFAAATAVVGVSPTDLAYVSRSLTGARMRVASAAVGSALTAEVQHYDGATWTTIGTLTITSGSVAEAVIAFTQVQSVGNMLRLNVTSVGATTAATGVVVDVLWS